MLEMFGSMLSSLMSTGISTSDAKTKVISSKKRVVGVCKLDEKKDQKPVPEQPKAKKKVRFETKPLVYGEKESCDLKNGNHHEQLKLKILMTKEEAARLLLKCKDGGRLEFRDVARELIQIPVNRVSLVSSRDHDSLSQGVDRKEL